MKGFEFDPLSLYGIKPIDTSLPTTMVQQTYNMKLLYSKAEVDAKIAAIPASSGSSTHKRVTSITSSATPTINTDNCDAVNITALATAITSMTTNLSGAPSDFDTLVFRIKDNGTARAITWGASFVAGGVALPTTTVISKVLTVGFIYDAVKLDWCCIASAQEA